VIAPDRPVYLPTTRVRFRRALRQPSMAGLRAELSAPPVVNVRFLDRPAGQPMSDLGRQRRGRPSAMATAVMIFANHGLTHRLDPGLIRVETAAAIPSETWTSVSAGYCSPMGLRSEQACLWCACWVADLARLRVPKAGFRSTAVGTTGSLGFSRSTRDNRGMRAYPTPQRPATLPLWRARNG
jgi:hypothetical protein